jgi:hypothetical protein
MLAKKDLIDTLQIAISALGYAHENPEQYTQFLIKKEVIPIKVTNKMTINMVKHDVVQAIRVIQMILDERRE